MWLRQTTSSWAVSGLRTRYFPKSRLGHGLISTAPWLNLALLLLMFVLLDKRIVLQPGTVVNLAQAPFTQGSHMGLVAVILSVSDHNPSARGQIVFFNDVRYLVGDSEQMRSLKQAMAARTRGHADALLVIQADRSVPHGVVMDVMNMAGEVGVRKVNVAVRPR